MPRKPDATTGPRRAAGKSDRRTAAPGWWSDLRAALRDKDFTSHAFLHQLSVEDPGDVRPIRYVLVLWQAKNEGYLEGTKAERIGGRVPSRLLSAAKEKTGITSQTELIEYALSKVALEDDYGPKLLSRKGRVPDDVEL